MKLMLSKLKAIIGKILRMFYYMIFPLMTKYPSIKKFLKFIVRCLPQLNVLFNHTSSRDYSQLKTERVGRLVLIDVTHTEKTGLHTGIQRVVRAIVSEFREIFPADIDIEPIVLSSQGGLWHYQYVNSKKGIGKSEIVVPQHGDIFIGLDLNAEISNAVEAGLFKDWRERGATIIFTVHDILPIHKPDWWPEGVSNAHEKWLRSVFAASDKIISVSKTTSDAVQAWAVENGFDLSLYVFDWFHLGADIRNSIPTTGYHQQDEKVVLNGLASSTTFLVVGTLEPRKGHSQCVAAFELLWKKGVDCNLVFVGKEGWMVDELIKKITGHPEKGRRFFWLDGISDEYLEQVYKASACLLAPSEGEGFGLPVIEAAQHGLPIIARDITIFREVAGSNAFYFKSEPVSDLANKVEEWLDLYTHGKHVTSEKLAWQTWRESAESLKNIIDV